MFFADPSNASLRAEDHAFLIGDDVLVEPILTEGDPHAFQTPPGIWREFTLVDEDPAVTPELPVLKIRGGAIVPLGRVVQSTAEALLEPLTLLVSLDEDGRAKGVLYEDAGDGYAYQDGDYLFTTYSAEQVEGEVRVGVESEEGIRPRPERTVTVIVVTDDGAFEGSGSETSTITVPLQ